MLTARPSSSLSCVAMDGFEEDNGHGTTVLIRRCDIGWIVAVDARRTQNHDDHKEILTDVSMKCNLTAFRNRLTVSCGYTKLSWIIAGAVRKYTCENPDNNLVQLMEAVKPLIMERLIDHSWRDETDPGTKKGTIAVLDREVDQILRVDLKEDCVHRCHTVKCNLQSICVMGSGTNRIANQIEKWDANKQDVSFLTETLWTNLRSAARRDDATGGHGLVFIGGPNDEWKCIRCRSLHK